MAYDKNKIFEQAKDLTIKNRLIFIEDIVALLPCDKTTFYRFFEPESNQYNELRKLLDANRAELKVSMRSKWYKSDAPALQMALYKLTASKEELKRLSVTYVDDDIEKQKQNIIIECPKSE